MNLGSLLHDAALRNPHKAAVIDGSNNATVSYQELDRSTTLFARRLSAGRLPGRGSHRDSLGRFHRSSHAILCVLQSRADRSSRERADEDARDRLRAGAFESKEIIIHGGSNISPQEVEEAIYSHPAVLEAAVIGMPDPAYGEQVVGFVSLREGFAASEAELIEHARRSLADYKVPERILFLNELPMGITGKLQRRVLKQMVHPLAGSQAAR